MPFSSVAKAQSDLSVQYTALGDSLAAGVNELSELGQGYSDFLAQYLAEDGFDVKYNKGFAYPGYKTGDVLADIKANVEKPFFTLGGLQQEKTNIGTAINDADVISLSVGANDVLKYIQRSATGEISFDAMGVIQEVQVIAQNVQAIFNEIRVKNSDADIIVMGYYNPFPYLDASYQAQLKVLVTTLDNTVSKIVEANGGIYVKVAEDIAANYSTYLPNPQNIHLSAAGYKAVAMKMHKAYSEKITADSLEGLTPTFSDISGHGAESYIRLMANTGIMKGYEDGMFKPNAQMNRIQIISVIARTFELKNENLVPFVDIQSYSLDTRNEISAAYEAGIVKGYGEYLKPNDKVTRAQLALMIARGYANLTGESYVPTKATSFTDIANYDQETQNAIALLYDYELAQGVGEGKFAPGSYVTRAQAAKILAGLLED